MAVLNWLSNNILTAVAILVIGGAVIVEIIEAIKK